MRKRRLANNISLAISGSRHFLEVCGKLLTKNRVIFISKVVRTNKNLDI